MLEDDFYTIDTLTKNGERIQASLSLHENHPIFEGHFPRHPVVPGVCMMQIIKELVEKNESRPLRIRRAAQLKFLTMIDPRRHPVIFADILCRESEAHVKISGRLFFEDTVFMKCDMDLAAQEISSENA